MNGMLPSMLTMTSIDHRNVNTIINPLILNLPRKKRCIIIINNFFSVVMIDMVKTGCSRVSHSNRPTFTL